MKASISWLILVHLVALVLLRAEYHLEVVIQSESRSRLSIPVLTAIPVQFFILVIKKKLTRKLQF